MSAQFKDREEMADYAADLVKRRANTKKHARLRKLGIAGRHSLTHWALRRLLHPAPADPLMLLNKRQRERMQRRPKPVANIAFHAPAESPYWVAFTKLYHNLFELSEFWSAKTDADRIKLIDRALWAEHKALTRGAVFSPIPTKKESDCVDRNKKFDLERHTETGCALGAEPTRELDQQRAEAAEIEADAVRAAVEALEMDNLRAAVNAYGRTLKKREHRHVVVIAVTEPTLSASAIAARCGVKAATVFKIRDQLYALPEQFISKRRPDVNSIEVDAPTVLHDEMVTQIADAPDALSLAETFHAPDVDADTAETVLGAYAHRGESARVLGSRWGVGGRRMFTDVELITGNYRGWGDPAKIAERSQFANKFSDGEMEELRQKAVAADFALNDFLRAIDAYYAKRNSADEVLASTLFKPKRSG